MTVTIMVGDVREQLRKLPDNHVHCVVTSPPYWGLRDYGVDGQIGLEASPAEFIATMVEVFEEVRRVLRPDGTCWVNIGDSYAGGGNGAANYPESSGEKQRSNHGSTTAGRNGHVPEGYKPKDLIGVPWSLATALRATGWWLRDAIIWAKPNGMPGSQTDRPTSSYEFVFLLTKDAHYWSDFDAIKTPPKESTLVRIAQNTQAQAGSHRANGGAKTNGTMKAVGNGDPVMMRNVWFIPPARTFDEHFAVMPDELARRCIEAGCPISGLVLDPFFGAGTTGLVADRLQRDCIGIELNPAYAEIARRRIAGDSSLFSNIVLANDLPVNTTLPPSGEVGFEIAQGMAK